VQLSKRTIAYWQFLNSCCHFATQSRLPILGNECCINSWHLFKPSCQCQLPASGFCTHQETLHSDTCWPDQLMYRNGPGLGPPIKYGTGHMLLQIFHQVLQFAIPVFMKHQQIFSQSIRTYCTRPVYRVSVRVTCDYFPQTTDCKELCSVALYVRAMYKCQTNWCVAMDPVYVCLPIVRTAYVRMYARVCENSWHQAYHPTIQTRSQLHCTSMSVSAGLLTSISKMKSMTLWFLLLFIVWPNAWSGEFILHTNIQYVDPFIAHCVSYICPVSCALCGLGKVM